MALQGSCWGTVSVSTPLGLASASSRATIPIIRLALYLTALQKRQMTDCTGPSIPPVGRTPIGKMRKDGNIHAGVTDVVAVDQEQVGHAKRA